MAGQSIKINMLNPIFALYLLVLIISCSTFKKVQNDKVCITLINKMPIVLRDGSLHNLYDTNNIVYYKHCLVLLTREDYEKTVDDIVTEKYKINKYFVYKQQDSIGYFYKDLKQPASSQLTIDSIRRMAFFEVNDFKLDPNQATLNKSNKTSEYDLEESYVGKKANEIGFSDTAYFYYKKKFNILDFSLSPKWEQEKKLKLVKIRVVLGGLSSNIRNKKSSDKAEILYEIKQASPENINEIIEFIDRFAKEHP